MPWGIAAGVVGAVGGALIGANASKSAANTQATAANNATASEMQMFNTQQGNLAPWMQAGQSALSSLDAWMGVPGTPGGATNPNAPGMQQFSYNPANDPAYNFMLNQGLGAITNQQSALGGVNGGNTMKALSDYAEGSALNSYQTEFNNWNTTLNNQFSRLSSMSGTGANAAGGIANLGMSAATQAGNNTIGAGNAIAAGQVGSANAYASGIQNLFNNPSWMSAFSTPANSAAYAGQNVNSIGVSGGPNFGYGGN